MVPRTRRHKIRHENLGYRRACHDRGRLRRVNGVLLPTSFSELRPERESLGVGPGLFGSGHSEFGHGAGGAEMGRRVCARSRV